MNVSGAIDTDLSNMPASELMKWGLENLVWKDGEEGGYFVKHGSQPVRDFGRPKKGDKRDYDPNQDNLFEKAFPVLYPYSYGSIETDRAVEVKFLEHVQWSL